MRCGNPAAAAHERTTSAGALRPRRGERCGTWRRTITDWTGSGSTCLRWFPVSFNATGTVQAFVMDYNGYNVWLGFGTLGYGYYSTGNVTAGTNRGPDWIGNGRDYVVLVNYNTTKLGQRDLVEPVRRDLSVTVVRSGQGRPQRAVSRSLACVGDGWAGGRVRVGDRLPLPDRRGRRARSRRRRGGPDNADVDVSLELVCDQFRALSPDSREERFAVHPGSVAPLRYEQCRTLLPRDRRAALDQLAELFIRERAEWRRQHLASTWIALVNSSPFSLSTAGKRDGVPFRRRPGRTP